ncbi:MAG: hypothetical protein OXQ84_06655 [bacterium]|nr:hypothetical protein [bacterium]
MHADQRNLGDGCDFDHGPNARALLQSLIPNDLSHDSFPFRARWEIGYALVRAFRITYVGELGWELYIATELTASLGDTSPSHENTVSASRLRSGSTRDHVGLGHGLSGDIHCRMSP